MSTARRAACVWPATLLALTLTLALTACSGDGDDAEPSSDQEGSSSTGASAPEEPAVRTVVSVRSLTGPLSKARKDQVKVGVTQVVDGWLDAAYVGGDYPRADFAKSFPGFSRGAAADATADLALMSNQDIGERVDAVTATKRRLKLDVLAVDGKAVTVTAQVALLFDTTGEVQRSERVKGELFLTYQKGDQKGLQKGEWQVFGYDMTKGVTR